MAPFQDRLIGTQQVGRYDSRELHEVDDALYVIRSHCLLLGHSRCSFALFRTTFVFWFLATAPCFCLITVPSEEVQASPAPMRCKVSEQICLDRKNTREIVNRLITIAI